MELGWCLAGRVGFVLVEGGKEGSTEKEHGANWLGIFEGKGGGVTVHFCVLELMQGLALWEYSINIC